MEQKRCLSSGCVMTHGIVMLRAWVVLLDVSACTVGLSLPVLCFRFIVVCKILVCIVFIELL